MWLLIAGCLLSAFCTSLLATYVMRQLAPKFGLIDKPAARKVHLVPTPLGGGIGIWCGVVLPLAAAQLMIWNWQHNPPDWLPDELARHLAGAVYRTRELWCIVAAATVLAVTGLADDFRPLSWKLRLLVQFGVFATSVTIGNTIAAFATAAPTQSLYTLVGSDRGRAVAIGATCRRDSTAPRARTFRLPACRDPV